WSSGTGRTGAADFDTLFRRFRLVLRLGRRPRSAVAKPPRKRPEAPAADTYSAVHEVRVGRRARAAHAGAQRLVGLLAHFDAAPVRHVVLDAAALPGAIAPGAAAVRGEGMRRQRRALQRRVAARGG